MIKGHLCCVHVQAGQREGLRGLDVTILAPNDDWSDHVPVFEQFFETTDYVEALSLALEAYGMASSSVQ